VSTATVPLGTLWVFCDRVREFSAQETNLLEIVAGRIASDLEREMLLVEAAKAKARQQQQVAAARWLAQRRPTVPPCIEDYQVAGAAPSEELQGSFYDWFGLPDGSLLVVAGHAPGQGWEAALAATAVQAALRAHADRVADPAALLAATSATLQAASPGEEGASLVAVQVRSGDGSVKVAGAGTFTLWNREGDRWQARLHQRPALGMEPDAQTGGFLEAEYPLVIGQTLAVSVGSGGQGRTASVAARGLRAKAATAARRSKQASNRGCSAEQLLASLKQAMGRGRLAPDQAGIIVIRRRG
jgi:hypothetical protein